MRTLMEWLRAGYWLIANTPVSSAGAWVNGRTSRSPTQHRDASRRR